MNNGISNVNWQSGERQLCGNPTCRIMLQDNDLNNQITSTKTEKVHDFKIWRYKVAMQHIELNILFIMICKICIVAKWLLSYTKKMTLIWFVKSLLVKLKLYAMIIRELL